ncbi:hypothetical protein J2T16_000204 [Paenibacillus intestini]|nr:hypothetical protein [Paenibacillus intestini]
MYFLMLVLVGIVLCIMFPYGPIIVGGIIYRSNLIRENGGY